MDFTERTNMKNIVLFPYLRALDWISQQGHFRGVPSRISAASEGKDLTLFTFKKHFSNFSPFSFFSFDLY